MTKCQDEKLDFLSFHAAILTWEECGPDCSIFDHAGKYRQKTDP